MFLWSGNQHFNRHSRREFVQIRLFRMQFDFDDDALGDFDEIAGAAVGLDDAEFGGGRRGDFTNAAAEMRAAEGIDGDVRLLAAADVFHVRFLDVGDNPARGGDNRHQLRARADELTFFDGDFAQLAVGGCSASASIALALSMAAAAPSRPTPALRIFCWAMAYCSFA